LIADDESAIRELLKAELDSAGYRVLAAADGEESLALFQKNVGEVCLLITDGEMPKMDGPAVIAAIRKLQPGLPVILTSAGGDPASMSNIYQVAKPFAFEDILASAQQILASSKPTST